MFPLAINYTALYLSSCLSAAAETREERVGSVRREKGYQEGTNDPTRASLFHHVQARLVNGNQQEAEGMRRRWETMKKMLMFSLSLSLLAP